MATLLVIGASRGIGRAAVDEALSRGHRVRALARGAAEISSDDPGLERIPADATDAAALGRALPGADAVILALGVKASLGRMFRRITLFSTATRALVTEMRRTGPRRLVAVTGFGAGDSRASMSLAERIPHRLLLGTAYDDKDRQEEIILSSGLDWLIVRPTILTGGPRTGRYRVLRDPAAWRNGLISRADVAHFLVAQTERPWLSHEAPVLAY